MTNNIPTTTTNDLIAAQQAHSQIQGLMNEFYGVFQEFAQANEIPIERLPSVDAACSLVE